jgi:hypothetical protein
MAEQTDSTEGNETTEGGVVLPTPEEVQQTEEENNPQPPNPEPELQEPYGKVVYLKGDQAEAPEDADVVIEDVTTQIIVKDRNGLTGVVASPELLDLAEVIE